MRGITFKLFRASLLCLTFKIYTDNLFLKKNFRNFAKAKTFLIINNSVLIKFARNGAKRYLMKKEQTMKIIARR